MRDVARLANVSSAAVSSVLSGRAGNIKVSEATRKRIHAAVEKLNYRPNSAARSLRRHQTDTIILLGTYSYSDQMASAAMALNDRNLDGLMVLIKDRQLVLDRVDDTLRSNRADGVILAGSCAALNDFDCAQLRQRGWPVFAFGRPFPTECGISSIERDWRRGFTEIASSLKARGHSKILVISEPPEKPTTAFRLASAKLGFADAGLNLPDRYIRNHCEAENGPVRHIHEAIGQQGLSFTAVIVPDQSFLPELYWALRQYGMSVPGDVSAVCLQKDDFTNARDPAAAGLLWPLDQMAREVVDAILTQRHQQPAQLGLWTHLSAAEVIRRNDPWACESSAGVGDHQSGGQYPRLVG